MLGGTTKKASCLITGTSGFLGGKLAERFKAAGWHVFGMGRRPGIEDEWIPFDLAGGEIHLPCVDVAIHAAYDFEAVGQGAIDRNLTATLRFFESVSRAGIPRAAFVSSLSAYDKAKSAYGRIKYDAEVCLLSSGVTCFRPGLVLGDGASGVSGSMARLVRRSRVVPMLGFGSQPVYICQIAGLVDAIIGYMTSSRNPGKPVVIASRQAISLKSLMNVLATEAGVHPLFVPVPSAPAIKAMQLAELLRVKLPFRSDSAIGLIEANPTPWEGVDWVDLPNTFHAASKELFHPSIHTEKT